MDYYVLKKRDRINETLDSVPTCRSTIYMALRVLLADESLNIKKNMQISLQDYGVEIKPLLTGEEVTAITKIFKPDIIFMDILLPKINGYDACSQLKNHPDFRHIPVILTWSNFMEIDEVKFRQSRANGRLEKPFDKQNLRKLIQHFVPRVKAQGLSEFLTLPDLRPQEGNNPDMEGAYSNTLTHFTPKGGSLADFKIEDDEEEFHQHPLPFHSTVPEVSPLATQNDEEEEWIPHSMHATGTSPMEENYEVEIAKIQLPSETSPPAPPAPEIDTLTLMGRPRKNPPPPPKYSGPPPKIEWNSPQLQEMIRTELRPMIEEIIANTLPDIAERILREEIQKLMRDTENEI